MSSSKYQMIRRWSTPTVKDWGIHKLFESSDKHRWFIKCSHCGYEQVMDYEKNIECVNPDGVDLVGQSVAPGSYQYVCAKCGKSLEKDRWYGGHWEVTADDPQNKDAGYAISQMDAVWVSADKLKEQELRATFKSSFYNYTLGLPYQDTENTFDGRYVLENRGDFEKSLIKTDKYTNTFVGIDFGQHFHSIIVLGITANGEIHYMNSKSIPKSTGVEHIEEDFNQIVNFIKPYKPTLIYADSGYSGNYVEKLQVVFGLSTVYGIKVRSALTNRDFNIHVNQSTNEITLDKLSQNLMLLSALRRGDIKFYHTVDQEIRTFINHGNNIIIRNDEKTDPNTKQVIEVPVILRKGADHYFQAAVYCFCAVREYLRNKNLHSQNIYVSELQEDAIGIEMGQDKTELSQGFIY